jgi:nucleotide-binding universal stress UspA family protein
MKNILVTLDLDKKESLLIDKALQLAKGFKSKIWLLHITAPDPHFVGYEAGPQHIRDNRAEELKKQRQIIQEYSSNLKQEGVSAEGIFIQGATIEMILEKSKKLNIDLIIAGHHKHGFFYKAFIGSVSSQIIKKSKIPVLIVPLD